jgi:rhodanese-related sulfurtransferase
MKISSELFKFPLVMVILIVATALFLTGCGTAQESQTNNAALAGEISVEEAYARREAGVLMLDVREPSEWEQAHIPGATLIPLGELQNRVNELPADQEIVVYCRSGNRSQSGRDILLNAGFDQVTSMAGGINDWQSAGYPTVSGP